MTPVLSVSAGPAAGQRFEIDRELVIGRADAELTIPDPELSRRHASVGPGEGGTLVITDLGSTNGTWINGVQVTGPTTLGPGDQLRLGDSTLALEVAIDATNVAGSPAPPPAPAAPVAQPAAPQPAVAAQSAAQPFGAFAAAPLSTAATAPAGAPRRQGAATRYASGMIFVWCVVAVDAAALVAYFLAR